MAVTSSVVTVNSPFLSSKSHRIFTLQHISPFTIARKFSSGQKTTSNCAAKLDEKTQLQCRKVGDSDVNISEITVGTNTECAIYPIHEPLVGKQNNDDITSSFKWRLLISYDGSSFSGWQYQNPSISTVQYIIENALTRVTKLHRQQLLVVGASRTDSGVHASAQVAHFLTPSPHYNLDTLHSALNGFLPPSVRVRQISPALPLFHARFSAQSKIYHYKIHSDTIIDPFQHKYAFHTAYRLNPIAMRQAANYFIGTHDFSAFVNASHNNHYRDPVKNIFRVDVFQYGPLFQVEVEGSGFLYRQVRNMVALLLQIGKEALPPDIVPHILASRDRKELAKYALCVPPHGLCLVAVNYNEDHLKLPIDHPSTSFGRYRTVQHCKLPYY